MVVGPKHSNTKSMWWSARNTRILNQCGGRPETTASRRRTLTRADQESSAFRMFTFLGRCTVIITTRWRFRPPVLERFACDNGQVQVSWHWMCAGMKRAMTTASPAPKTLPPNYPNIHPLCMDCRTMFPCHLGVGW